MQIITLRQPGSDNLTPADYREIFDELRANRSLRALVETAGAAESRIAYWSRYQRNPDAVLDFDGRNMLRRLVGLPELEPDAGDVVAAAVHPAAEVWQVGDAASPAERVLLLATSEPVTIYAAGNEPPVVSRAQNARVQSCTRGRGARRRKPYWRPALSAKLTPEQRVMVCEFAAALLHEETP